MATNPPLNKKPKCVTFKCVKDFQRILECPICFLTPNNPEEAKFCSNGHMICGNCCRKVNKCPVCRSENLNGQGPLLKQILTALPKLCPFEGCEAEPEENELEDHRKNCEFRKLDCITYSRLSCKEKVPYNTYLEHLEENHKGIKSNVYDIVVNESTFTKDILDWNPNVFTNDGKTFFIKCVKIGNLFRCQCFILGTEEEATKYVCEIEVKSKDPKYSIKMTGDVISVDVKRVDFEKEAYFDNFMFSKAMAQKIWDKERKSIVIQATIKKR